MQKFLAFSKGLLRFFREHLFWKVFVVFFLSFVFLSFLVFLSARYYFEKSLETRIDHEEQVLVASLTRYWQEYYLSHQGWPEELRDKFFWSSALRQVFLDPTRSRFFLLLGPNAINEFSLYNNNYQKISGVVDRRVFDEFDFFPSLEVVDQAIEIHIEGQEVHIQRSKTLKGAPTIDPNIEKNEQVLHDLAKMPEDAAPPNQIEGFFASQIFSKPLLFGKSQFEYSWKPLSVGGNLVGWMKIPDISSLARLETRNFFNAAFRGIYQSYLPLVLLVTIVFSFVLTRMILRPISSMNRGLKALKQKNFDFRVHYPSQDEFGQLAQQFNLMAEEMQSFLIRKKMWVSAISHELKTPLTILKGQTEAILEGVRKLDQKQIETLHTEISGLISLTDDLQSLASADSENLRLRLAEYSVKGFCEKIERVFTPLFQEKGLELVIDYQHKEDRLVFDASLLERALYKVLENALKYSNPGKVWLRTSEDKSWFQFLIEDQGPGMQEAELSKVFEAFYRGEASRSRTFGGSGLGLAIYQVAFKLHQGKTRAFLNPEGGLSLEGSIKKDLWNEEFTKQTKR